MMQAYRFTASALNLLAGQATSPLENLQREFQRRAATPIDISAVLWFAAGVILLVGVVAVILRLADILRTGKPYRSHGLLFLQLCRAHGLTRRESLYLWQLARKHGLHSAAQVFLAPDVLSRAEGETGCEMAARLLHRLFPPEIRGLDEAASPPCSGI